MELDQLELDPPVEAWGRAAAVRLAALDAARGVDSAGVECVVEASGGCASSAELASGEVTRRLTQPVKNMDWSSS